MSKRATQDDTREHKHGCADSTDATHGLGGVALCMGRGYHRCACGATMGLSRKSEWIKSHATSDPFKVLDGAPFR
jgi:hypothetical protein